MTEQELDDMITEQIDRERGKDAILKLEIEMMKKAVEQGESIGKGVG